MKFCPVVPEICRGQVHVQKKERRIKRIIILLLFSLFSFLINNNNNNKKRSKNNKSPKLCLGDLINIYMYASD
jgi:hypothetical protein